MLKLLIENTLDRRIVFMKIKDIGRVVTGKTPLTGVDKYYGGNIMFISPSDLHGDYLIEKSEKTITEEGLKSIESNSIKGISVLTGCIGWDMGNVAMCNSRCATNQQINAIIDFNDKLVDPRYVFYWLKGKKDYLFSIASVTRTPILSKSVFEDIDIPLPSLEVQKKVAKLLSLIDEKIMKNHQINDYLEEMAKALYDYWFVQFDFPDKNGKPYKSSGGALLYNEVLKKEIPFGWTIDTLGNLLSKVPNSTKIPATDFCDKGSIPVIDQSSDFIAGYTDDETSLLSNKTGYIVFGDHTRVVKYIRFPFARGADGTQVINSNNRCMPNELFYQVIKSIDLSNYGYARHFKYLKDTIIAIPSANLADIYAEKVGKWYENQVSIMKENIALSQLRDWLLPMLMNGQATIEN